MLRRAEIHQHQEYSLLNKEIRQRVRKYIAYSYSSRNYIQINLLILINQKQKGYSLSKRLLNLNQSFLICHYYFKIVFQLLFIKQLDLQLNFDFKQLSMEDSESFMNDVCQKLLKNQKFLNALAERIPSSSKISISSDLDDIIQQIQQILQQLIRKKLEMQMSELIEDNNRILMQIKNNLQRKQNRIIEGSSSIDTSFTQIHNIINQEKRKALDRFTDAELEKSISFMDRYEDVVEKVQQIQKKVKGLQDKYQTNFKSLWNVLSMTQSAVFEHIKQNKINKNIKTMQNIQPKSTKDSSFLMSFWK